MVTGMRSVVVDKIASVTQACGLSHEVRVATDIPCRGRRGGGRRGPHQQVAPTTRSSSPAAAWPRWARATSSSARSAIARRCSATPATCPRRVQPGDVIQMLNIGGVLGICDSVNPDKGKPFDCRVLGVVLHFPYLGERIGVPARVGLRAELDLDAKLDTRGVPVVALAGTCMEAGKTAAACAIISRMRHRGLGDGRRLQGHGRIPAPRHPGDGGCRRAPHRHLHRPRGRHHHARQRPGAHAHHAHRARRRQARRHRVRAGRRHPRHLRRRCHPRVSRTSAPRSPASCCRPTIRSPPGAA